MNRFRAPQIDIPLSIDWLLHRTLAPGAMAWDGDLPIDLDELRQCIGAWELLPRVWARNDGAILQRELTTQGFRVLERLFREAVAVELRDAAACQAIAECAGKRRIPLMFLKGMALRLGGYASAGVRRAADIDILVPEESSQVLFEILLHQGGAVKDLPASDQHLPVLEHSTGVPVEIHHRIHGLRFGGTQDARFESLQRAGLCRQLEGWNRCSFLPSHELLVAHLLIHALGQHVYSPAAYPQIQLLVDLHDLGFSSEAERVKDGALARSVKSALGRDTVEAVRGLIERMESGERFSQTVAREDSAGMLARHISAGAMDREYRQALKIQRSVRDLVGRSDAKRVGATLGKALFLTRGQIDIIYGPPRSSWGYLGRWLWRPVDLAGRVIRSALTWVRVRMR